MRKFEKLTLGYLLERCRVVGVDAKLVGAVALDATSHLSKNGNNRVADERPLEVSWYESVAAGSPSYDVYGTTEYIGELYACWIAYSRKYLLALQKDGVVGAESIADALAPNVVVDLGCGIGFTTAALKQLFPSATVVGTNLQETPQRQIAERVGNEYGFSVKDGPDTEDAPTGLVFASEYFEHFEAPVKHLRDVLDALNPNALVIANAFGSRSIGHFDVYDVDGKPSSPSATSRAFGAELRRRGYGLVKTKFWNNRPTYWSREISPTRTAPVDLF